MALKTALQLILIASVLKIVIHSVNFCECFCPKNSVRLSKKIGYIVTPIEARTKTQTKSSVADDRVPDSSLNNEIRHQIVEIKFNSRDIFLSFAFFATSVTFLIISSGSGDLRDVQPWLQSIQTDIWDGYMKILTENPVGTKAFTSATVYTIGDVIAQRVEGADWDTIDHSRSTRSMIAGLVGHGPLSHVWYNVCDSLFENILHITQWWSFLPKIVIDQAIWSPIWNNTYFILLGIMQQDSIEKMWSNVKTSTIPLLVSGLKLWPMAHVITYGLIPNENRLLWVDFVEIMWVTILAAQAASLSRSTLKPENSIS